MLVVVAFAGVAALLAALSPVDVLPEILPDLAGGWVSAHHCPLGCRYSDPYHHECILRGPTGAQSVFVYAGC